MSKISGTGKIASTDFKEVKWVGITKGGEEVIVTLKKAINLGNIDWAFADKDDTVASVTFTACYDNTDSASESDDEPWEIETSGIVNASDGIICKVGKFYIGETPIALTRGGGSFVVTRETRQIVADGDRGPVEGRVVMETSVATLTMNALTFLNRVADIYPGITVED